MARVPTWHEVAAFCGRNGYPQDERTHHTYYTREPMPGFVSQTYISRSAGNTRVPTPLWAQVWRDQLRLRSEVCSGEGWMARSTRTICHPRHPKRNRYRPTSCASCGTRCTSPTRRSQRHPPRKRNGCSTITTAARRPIRNGHDDITHRRMR